MLYQQKVDHKLRIEPPLMAENGNIFTILPKPLKGSWYIRKNVDI